MGGCLGFFCLFPFSWDTEIELIYQIALVLRQGVNLVSKGSCKQAL